MDKLKYIENISSDALDDKLIALYTSNSVLRQKRRITKAIDKFSEIYPQRNDIHIYSASGRTEIGGNHTDHQHGCVIAAAVNLDVIGVTAFHNDGVVRIKSEGYDAFQISLDDLEIHKDELGTSAIVRGILYKFSKIGNKIGGFDMYITSDILSGSGISSSAGFENLISTALDCYYNDGKIGAIEIAKIGQYAENIYFGKNSGLMDQMVSSVGGFVYIDFKDIENPTIEKIDFNLDNTGYKLIVTDTKGSHSDLTDDYVAIRNEMELVAKIFGKKVLREVNEIDFYDNLTKVRESLSDRAVLRAVHFFDENKRAYEEAERLKHNDFNGFLKLVRQSGMSSENYLQNLYSSKSPTKQEIPLALMVGKKILGKDGTIRVHGGGFAGTIQGFVPEAKVKQYVSAMNGLFGNDACYTLSVRSLGGTEII
ncbi:MAG: galactokinase family protein [Oscillospiraceae bacterium]